MPPDVSLNVVLKTIPVFSCSMSSASAATLETTTLGSCAKVCTGQLLNVYEDSTNLLELAQGFRWPTEYVNGRSRFNSRKLLNKTDEVDQRAVRLTPRRTAKWFPPHTLAEGFRLRGRAENELRITGRFWPIEGPLGSAITRDPSASSSGARGYPSLVRVKA